MWAAKATTSFIVWPVEHVDSNMSVWQNESSRNASRYTFATFGAQTCVILLVNTLTSQVTTMTQTMWNPTLYPSLPNQVTPVGPYRWDSNSSYSGSTAYAPACHMVWIPWTNQPNSACFLPYLTCRLTPMGSQHASTLVCPSWPQSYQTGHPSSYIPHFLARP